MNAQSQLETDLKALGFNTEAVVTAGGQPFVLLPGFIVASGRFEGRQIDLALEAPPNYPHSLGSALHVRAEPALLQPGTHPAGYNVLAGNSALGADWQYWSFNLSAMWQGGLGASLSSIINGVMDRA